MTKPLLGRLEKVLGDAQAYSLNTNICKKVVKVLDSDNNVKPEVIEKLLEMCIQDPKDDVQYATEALNVVSVILKKVTAGGLTSAPDLFPSLLEILRLIKTTIYSCSLDQIKILYFKTLISYPDEVYLKLEDDSEILELFNLYFHPRIPMELRLQPINVLHKYLRVLPPDKKTKIVEQGINIWLLKLIPSIMSFATILDFEIETSIVTLEMIANEFFHIDYQDNPNLQRIIQCFCEPPKYPNIMKNLLIKGSAIWHRLWMIFIKLLKNQLTKSGSSGSPINSMLPVVERAFKMDVTSRCHAFECWNVLIENFATETNEPYINKRLKLLVIPLYANNTKVEETVIAKMNTWWVLIRSYYSKLKNFSDTILLPFLQFCFGKSFSSDSENIPGSLTNKTKELCVESLTNIMGHHNCDGCVSLPILKEKIINGITLLPIKKHLIYYMNAAIKYVENSPNTLRRPFQCAWISFAKLISEVPDIDMRRDIFNELLVLVEKLVQVPLPEVLADIILNDLILTLYKIDDQIMKLFNTEDGQCSPLPKIFSIILNPLFDHVYKKYEMAEAIQNFKPIADFTVQHCCHSDTIIEALLNNLSANYKSLVLWTVMASSIWESKCGLHSKALYELVMWPMKHLDLLLKVELSTSLWLALFEFEYTKVNTWPINNDILEIINDSSKINAENSSFYLNVALLLLSKKLTSGEANESENQVHLVHNLLSNMKIKDLNEAPSIFSKVIGIVPEIFENLIRQVNLDIAKHVLMILKLVFAQLMLYIKTPIGIDPELLMKIQKVWKCIKELFKLEDYASLKQIVFTEYLEYVEWFGQLPSLKIIILDALETSFINMDNNNPSVKMKHLLEFLKSDKITACDKSKFVTPVNKKAKKKDTSIVNTVVEDGEEFVVVKSNWKFNPKKLTENQKEKLQRKREDIPALYQDLSQSQEEFKLSTWKTDSQDTTTTTTSSKSNDLTSEKASSILKNMPNTDVVSKIIKNILTENNEKVSPSLEPINENMKDIQTPNNNNKSVKPKLALKDRISRNVRNLIQNSNVQTAQKPLNDNATAPLHTPDKMSILLMDTVINSAPSDVNCERPSRLKRKPKKFEEMQIFALKKRRNSLGNGESQTTEICEGIIEKKLVTENSDLGNINLNPSRPVLEQQNNCNSETSNLGEEVIKCDVENNQLNENILNNEQVLIVHGEKHDTQQQISQPNEVATKSHHNMENNVTLDSSIVSLTDESQKNVDQLEKNEDSSNENLKDNRKIIRKKSRIEKELAIDMVEGHPFLKVQSEKRLTRKKAKESPIISKRKSLNLQKPHINLKNTKIEKPQAVTKDEQIDKLLGRSRDLHTFTDSQETNFRDENGSQDIIESSQDSTVSILSVKSSKTVKRVPIIALEKIECNVVLEKNNKKIDNNVFPVIDQKDERYSYPDKINPGDKCLSQDNKVTNNSVTSYSENNDESEFPLNKTAVEYIQIDLTENMDTQPIANGSSDEVIVINDEKESQFVNNVDDTYVNMETQDIAEADTQPIVLNALQSNEIIDTTNKIEILGINTPANDIKINLEKNQENVTALQNNLDTSSISMQDECNKSLTGSLRCVTETKQDESLSKLSSGDEEQRKQDFLNNTLEISPIKILSPVRENKSPSLETSSDYVVIKLSSPVQSNGEPYEKCDSPEVFTEDKISPDRRDQSPPREETRVSTASPRSLSLKKNKPQVRSGGRAAQMLGLCVPASNRLQTKLNSEKTMESEELKKCSPLNSSARRNLRILYNSASDVSETTNDNDEDKTFLKMKRSLPAADSSPSVPILKRKLADIVDDGTVSPVSKRKRVSFHDPPVSTTICVKKYIEPTNVRSPQNSATKRQERQLQSQAFVNLKSPKRLDTVFKLDKALIKAVESFNEHDVTPNSTEDTEMSSLEPTPLVELVKNSELNDVDPICVELVNCKDPVDNIAGDLSSSAMRPLLVKEFAGKIETVGDLAKLTELEVNRLCIKAPKVQVAKKVLTAYVEKINIVANEITPMTEAAFNDSAVDDSKVVDMEISSSVIDPLFNIKTTTVADLADASELEENILNTQVSKTPVTEKVVIETNSESNEMTPNIEAVFSESSVAESTFIDVEMQTDCIEIGSIEVQTESLPTSVVFTQTEVFTVDCDVQTNESGTKSSVDIAMSLLEKPDYCERLNDLLDVATKKTLASSLPLNALTDAFLQKIEPKKSNEIMDMLLEKHASSSLNGRNDNSKLSFMQDYLSKSFCSKDLILLCSELLRKVHDNV